MERPFLSGTFYMDYLYLAPDCSNMYIRLNIVTGEMTEWKPPFTEEQGKEYFYADVKSSFLWGWADEDGKVKVFSYPGRKLYEINLGTNSYSELDIQFNFEELKVHEPGFCRRCL